MKKLEKTLAAATPATEKTSTSTSTIQEELQRMKTSPTILKLVVSHCLDHQKEIITIKRSITRRNLLAMIWFKHWKNT